MSEILQQDLRRPALDTVIVGPLAAAEAALDPDLGALGEIFLDESEQRLRSDDDTMPFSMFFPVTGNPVPPAAGCGDRQDRITLAALCALDLRRLAEVTDKKAFIKHAAPPCLPGLGHQPTPWPPVGGNADATLTGRKRNATDGTRTQEMRRATDGPGGHICRTRWRRASEGGAGASPKNAGNKGAVSPAVASILSDVAVTDPPGDGPAKDTPLAVRLASGPQGSGALQLRRGSCLPSAMKSDHLRIKESEPASMHSFHRHRFRRCIQNSL